MPIEFLASGVEPGSTVCALAVGVYLSASLAAGVTKYAAAILSVDLSGYVMTRFPFSSTLYVVPGGKLAFAFVVAAIILFFSSSLTLLGSATSTFSPATASSFLVSSKTVTLRSLVTVTFFLLVTANFTTVSPAGCSQETVPS